MAQAGKKPAAPAKSSPEFLRAVAQADGITGAVVDGLWNAADVYWHQGDYNRIVALCRVCVEADPNFDEAYSAAAWLLWSMDDTKGADEFLNYAVQKSPGKGIFHWELGWHLFNTKRYADALPYLKKAVALGNVPLSTYTTLGHCYTRLNRFDDAVAAWQTVVKRYPDFGSGKKNLKQAQERAAAARTRS